MFNLILSFMTRFKLLYVVVIAFLLWAVAAYIGGVIQDNERLNDKVKRLEAHIVTINKANEQALKVSYQQLEFERTRYDNAKIIYEEATRRLANDRCATENIPNDVISLLQNLDSRATGANDTPTAK